MTHAPRPRIEYPLGDGRHQVATCRDCGEPLVRVNSGRLSLPGEKHWRHHPQRGTRLQPPVFDVLGGKR